MKTTLSAIAAFLFLVIAGRAVEDDKEPRTALVMGAWKYTGAKFQPLPGVAQDVGRMAEKLQGLGFEVMKVENPDLAQAEQALDDFGDKLKTKKGVGVFYFSGHGAEMQGRNYLIPVGINKLNEEMDLKVKAIDAQMVLNRMSSAKARINLVFLDCCRNEMSKGTTSRGLAPMQASGVFIGFATASGATAAASTTGSPYTNALLKHIGRPGLEVKQMHTLVTADVMLETRKEGNEQSPFENSSLTGSFFFQNGPAPAQGAGLSEAEIRQQIESAVTESLKSNSAMTAEQLREIVRAEMAARRPNDTAATAPPNTPAPSPGEPSPWLFPDSSSRYLSDNELASIPKNDLWRARNEIYARKGYVFTTPRGKEFAQRLGPLYRPRISDMNAAERAMNPYEKANVLRIKVYEH